MYIPKDIEKKYPFRIFCYGHIFSVCDINRNEWVANYTSEDDANAKVKELNEQYWLERHAQTEAYWAIEKAKGTDKDFGGVYDSLWAKIAEFVRKKLKAMA